MYSALQKTDFFGSLWSDMGLIWVEIKYLEIRAISFMKLNPIGQEF